MTTILPLTLKAAVLERRARSVLGPIDFILEGGGCTTVIGPNGAGKTSLLRLMHGLDVPSAGTLKWANANISIPDAQSFVFQTPILLRRPVLENLIYPLRLRGMAKQPAAEKAHRWIERIGLSEAEERNAIRLSAGEKQKLSVARALITDPQVLFLDEPTANLDGGSTKAIEDMLTSAQASGTRLVLATHDMGQARRLATEVIFLHHGEILEFQPAKDFFAKPKTEQAEAFLKGDIVE